MANSPDPIPFWILSIFGSLAAASLGSFYVTLGFRILEYFYGPKRKSHSGAARWRRIFLSPSACDSCGTEIRYPELLPVVGYLFVRGKCKRCKVEIPPFFPLVEATFVCVFLFCLYFTKNAPFSLVFLFFCGHLLISCLTDVYRFSLDYENLPWILFFGTASVYLLEGKLPGWTELYVFAGFASCFLALYFLFPGGIGFGDVLFAPVFALVAGHPWWMFFLNASYIPAVLFTLVFRKKGASLRKTPIPMGVYFSLGIFLTFCARILFDSGIFTFVSPFEET
ncbi:prepilin peptidase [Leptospira ellisii]|uniref:Prepilin peptidase n=1 Tax=Leptospira ellisii TaxID=2023197 RepID=A0AAE4QPG1_9LEPT|nr:A24 family peptidase [Leptospira ellisii]MDV6236560.1 prepilin peptidase [Leptospira ellisii]PKA03065.1 prepilin peptidase [Leptospira ellisii]